MPKPDSAVQYAQKLGWAIVPLHWVRRDGSCSCGDHPCKGKPGKHPYSKLVPRGVLQASSDPDVVAAWWAEYPEMNIGVRTGPESGIAVLDIDSGGGKRGASSFKQMQADAGDPLVVRDQVSAQSGSGGLHYFFSWPTDADVRNATNVGGYEHVDLKGRDGYIIVDPSENSAGAYKWLAAPHQPGATLPPLPTFLIQCSQSGGKAVQKALLATKPFGGPLPPRVEALRGNSKVARYLDDRKPRPRDRDKSDSGIDLQTCIALLNHNAQLADWELHHALLWSWKQNELSRAKHDSYFESTISKARASTATSPQSFEQPEVLPALTSIPPTTPIQVLGTGDRFNAMRFEAMWKGRLLWSASSAGRGRWLEYNSGLWKEGSADGGLVKCDEIVRHYDSEIRQLEQAPGTNPDVLSRYRTERDKMQGTPARSRALSIAKELLSAEPIQFDSNPFTVLCEDTVLDLSGSQVQTRDPGPDDYFRSRMRASWSGPAESEVVASSFWEDRLGDWLPDPEVREAFQMFIGLCVTGGVAHQVFGFLYGSGGTGKSTAANAILRVLGGYGVTSRFAHFTRQRASDSARAMPHLVRMRGKRLVAAFEVDPGASFDTAFLKALTGGEKVVGRGLYQEEIEFDATAKLLFVGNDRPRVEKEDLPLWRRLLVFGFHASQLAKRDVDLPRKLALPEVRNQILHWAVEGWFKLQQKAEFPIPKACHVELEKWQADADPLRDFFEERCKLEPQEWASSQELWEAYVTWTGGTRSGLNRPAFGRAIVRPGVTAKRRGDKANSRGYQGIRLRAAEPEVTS